MFAVDTRCSLDGDPTIAQLFSAGVVHVLDIEGVHVAGEIPARQCKHGNFVVLLDGPRRRS